MNAVVHLTKCKPNSMIASARIARFIATQTGADLVDCSELAEPKYKTLFIVNGPMAFSDFLPEIAEMVNNCERIIWVQNDIIIKPPTTDPSKTRAESPFRKAFANYGKPLDYWTTLPSMVKTDGSAYINWNMLTYDPLQVMETRSKSLLYYGAYRQDRDTYFRKYLGSTAYPITVSAPVMAAKKFHELNHTIEIVKPFTDLIPAISSYAGTVYMEDIKSHTTYCSPANRFYECLSAGLPMFFDKGSVKTLEQAGYDVSPFIVKSPEDVYTLLNLHGKVQYEQLKWRRDYRSELVEQLMKAVMEKL